MGNGCYSVRTSRWEYVSHASTVTTCLTLYSDTPWDEPTDCSPEFCRYLSGEIFNETPWTNFSTNALCTLTLPSHDSDQPLCSSDLWHVDPGSGKTHDHVRDLFTSLVYKVSSNSGGKAWLFTPIRPSQLATRGVHALAEQLTQSLRDNGDLIYANPDVSGAG